MTETTSLPAGVETTATAPQSSGLAGLKLAQLRFYEIATDVN